MTFLQPAFLWGLLGVTIPVLIHLWHQKRGQPLPWAAMQWLREANEQQQRGFRFDNWLLLAVRCLLIALLAVLLAKPVWPPAPGDGSTAVVHLVAADPVVTATFRFEHAQARKRGELVLPLPVATAANPLRLQPLLDSLSQPSRALHLYIRPWPTLADVPQLTVPSAFTLHTAPAPQPASAANPAPFSERKKPLTAWLNYQNPQEKQTVRAALRALAEVYNLDLTLNDAPVAPARPDWVLSDRLPNRQQPTTLYTVSGGRRFDEALRRAQSAANVVYTPDTLTPQTSERVANGQLPEWLGKQLGQFYKRNLASGALTQQELAALFVPTPHPDQPGHETGGRTTAQSWLLLTLIVTVGVERWLALRK